MSALAFFPPSFPFPSLRPLLSPSVFCAIQMGAPKAKSGTHNLGQMARELLTRVDFSTNKLIRNKARTLCIYKR